MVYYFSNYDNIISLLIQLQCGNDYHCMQDFCIFYNLENLLKALTCFENANKPSANDYIAKNDNKLNENLKLSTEKTIKFQPCTYKVSATCNTVSIF